MTKQAEEFLYGEGDAWHERNKRAELNYNVVNAVVRINPSPNGILEVGCGNARYLGEIHRYVGGRAVGIDPSHNALQEGRKNFPDLTLKHNDARAGLQREAALCERYDIIFFGFCLYLVDRDDLFQIVAAADEVLKRNGHLIIYDFLPSSPSVVPYKHRQGLYSFKMNYSQLWLANPAYRLVDTVFTNEDCTEGLTILQKKTWRSNCRSGQ